MKVYVAGPYTPNDGREEKRLENIRRASEVAQRLLKAGHTPFCPHTMTAGWEATCGYDDFLRLGMEWLALCDAILLLPGWEQSRGARREHEEAVTLGLLVADDLESLVARPAEAGRHGGAKGLAISASAEATADKSGGVDHV